MFSDDKVDYLCSFIDDYDIDVVLVQEWSRLCKPWVEDPLIIKNCHLVYIGSTLGRKPCAIVINKRWAGAVLGQAYGDFQ